MSNIRTTEPTPVPCSPAAGLLSEGPRWDADRDELLWVDAGRVFCVDGLGIGGVPCATYRGPIVRSRELR